VKTSIVRGGEAAAERAGSWASRSARTIEAPRWIRHLKFLLDVVFSLLTYSFLLALFAMQWLRAPFRNPVGQAVAALTDWAGQAAAARGAGIPRHRLVDVAPRLARGRLLWLVALALVVGRAGPGAAGVVMLALLAVVEIVKAMLWLLIIVVIAQAILSWTSPDGPLAGVLNALTFRFLAPIRRLVPPIGGTLDLSPLILIVVLQLVLMLPVAWLEGGGCWTLFR